MRGNNKPGISKSGRKQIGAFFTPLWIACEMVKTYELHRTWADGKSILDPTAGSGNLLEALIHCCLEENIPITHEMLGRLKGIEREKEFTDGFAERILNNYNLTVPDDLLINGDFLMEQTSCYDRIFGNPPWLNFTDLPEDQKEQMKTHFRKYGLVEKGMRTLLGGSRIDLSALIIQKAMQDHLTEEGIAYFFIPLSLVLNEGAHNKFRRGLLKNGFFSTSEIRDFGENRIFKDVSTRCGFAVLKKSVPQKERIPYLTMSGPGIWEQSQAGPVGSSGNAFRILDDIKPPTLIRMNNSSRPRQGINTGGRNHIFIFDSAEQTEEDCLIVRNKFHEACLPSALIYPLITNHHFKGNKTPCRFIFLPYTPLGKVLEEEELVRYPAALKYLMTHRDTLVSRKGSMLQSTMKKGRFWSLLGVGPYTFAPWKIVWEAYGKKEFNPQIFGSIKGKPWIPNQALQASCAFASEEEAKRVLHKLKDPDINRILKQYNMEGTCNWAQPGRMVQFMEFGES